MEGALDLNNIPWEVNGRALGCDKLDRNGCSTMDYKVVEML